MTREQAILGTGVLYRPWAAQKHRDRYGIILSRPVNDTVQVQLGRVVHVVPLQDLQPAPRPLADELELIDAMKKEMKFVDAPQLQDKTSPAEFVRRAKLNLIRYFERAYSDTDQDTVVYGPEFVIVVRNILAGKVPVKLRFLTDFEGEER